MCKSTGTNPPVASNATPVSQPIDQNPSGRSEQAGNISSVELSMPNGAKKQVRFLSAHPKQSVRDQFPEEATSQLKHLMDNGCPLVSFNSPLGHKWCSHYVNENCPIPKKNTQAPSLLELCLSLPTNNREVSIDGVEYEVQVSFKNDWLGSAQGGPSTFAGEIELIRSRTDSRDNRKIPFVEFAPQFDGKVLKAEVLNKCQGMLSHFLDKSGVRETLGSSQDAVKMGLFSSARGICRSASLLVMDQFAALHNEKPFSDDAAVEEAVRGLIDSLRSGSRKGVLPFAKQHQEIVDACKAIFVESGNEAASDELADAVNTTSPPSGGVQKQQSGSNPRHDDAVPQPRFSEEAGEATDSIGTALRFLSEDSWDDLVDQNPRLENLVKEVEGLLHKPDEELKEKVRNSSQCQRGTLDDASNFIEKSVMKPVLFALCTYAKKTADSISIDGSQDSASETLNYKVDSVLEAGKNALKALASLRVRLCDKEQEEWRLHVPELDSSHVVTTRDQVLTGGSTRAAYFFNWYHLNLGPSQIEIEKNIQQSQMESVLA